MSGFFSWAVAYTMRNEGGFVNDPDDPGGATKYGITRAVLAHRRCCEVTAADVQALTLPEAQSIYETNYWIPTGLDTVKKPSIAIAVFDAGVLFGTGPAMLSAQKALADCGYTLTLDGHLGPLTTAAMNGIKPAVFITAFIAELQERIEFIISKNPTDSKYRSGWLQRVSRYQTLI